MGLVYSAWDVRLQRDVAIKLLREEFLTPAMRSRFLQEARAASRLNHPNICTIFDIGEQQGDPYMVMELLKGETIRQRMTRGAMSVEDILSLAIDVADALVVAHAQGVVHRDIKPANIILVEKPGGGFQTKVLDFGLAKVDSGGLSGESRFDLTSIGTTVGTVSYMSPEQARGESLDARSDLFSLGVVLYEMSTGQLPFRGATSALVFVQLLSHRPDPVREFNAEIPRDLERVINRLLEKGRNDRFQSARELVQALQQVFLKKTAAARPSWSQVLLGRKPELPGGAPKLDPSPASPGTARPLDASPPPVSQSSESVLRPVKRILPRPDSLPPGPSPVSAHSEPPASPPSVPPSAGPAPAPSRFSAPPASRPSGYEPEEEPIEATSLPRFVAPGGRLLQRRPLRRFDPGDRDDYQRLLPDSRSGDFSDPRVARSHRALWTALSAALGVALLALMVWYFINHRPAEGGPEANSLALGPIANHSGDVGLGAAILTGLRLDLQQSTELSIRGPADFSSGLTLAGLRGDAISGDSLSVEDARRAARNIAAAQFLLGDVRNTGVGFATSIRVYDADTGNTIADVTESASTREQIPGSIDRLAADLRSALGESSDSIARTAVPLDREASSNLDALEGYAKAQSLMSAGHVVDAISTLQQVILLEPHFTAARLLLTEIFRRQHAEVAAAKSAADAVTSAAAACQRTQWLAQASYDINSIGDYGQAVQVLQQITRDYPGRRGAEEFPLRRRGYRRSRACDDRARPRRCRGPDGAAERGCRPHPSGHRRHGRFPRLGRREFTFTGPDYYS
jgi:serine/threonine protein kinase